MKKQRVRKKPIAEINVVPYVDVMLVLLVIFMITTPLLTEGVSVSLPHAKAKTIQSPNQVPIVVSVNDKGEYFLNISSDPNHSLTAQALLTRVAAEMQLARQAQQTRQVLVKGDRHVEYDKVVSAMVLLQQAGVKNVGLVTQSVG